MAVRVMDQTLCVRLEASSSQVTLSATDILRAVDHYLTYAEPRFREVALIERMIDLRRTIASALEMERKATLEAQEEELKKEEQSEDHTEVGQGLDGVG